MTSHYEQVWDQYSRWWDSEAGLSGTHRYLGDEWGDDRWVASALEQFAFPHLSSESTVLEIGPGGGRYTARIATRCSSLLCVDVSSLMLERVQRRLGDRKQSCFLKGNGQLGRHPGRVGRFCLVLQCVRAIGVRG